MDFLYFNKNCTYPYLLILRNSFSKYTRIIPAMKAEQWEVAAGIAWWCADLATPDVLVSDLGTHKRLYKSQITTSPVSVPYQMERHNRS